MILVHATIDIKASKRGEEVARTVVAFQNEALHEPGCREYIFADDLEKPGRIHVLERWESNDDLMTHMGTARSAEFATWMTEMAEKVAVNRYEVSEDQSDEFRKHSQELMGDTVQT
jgi:quinol monooxygenase YgiN